MDIETFHRFADLLSRFAVFIARGHLDPDDVLVLSALTDESVATPGDVVRALGLSAPAVSRRVAKLRDLDLITEQVSSDDLRKCQLKPTVKCSSVLHEIRREFPDGQAEEALALHRLFAAYRLAVPGEEMSFAMALVLGALAAAGTPLRIRDIARLVCRPQSSVSTAAAALKRRGLVRRIDGWTGGECASGGEGEPGEEAKSAQTAAAPAAKTAPAADGRSVFLELTERGRELAAACASCASPSAN